MSDTIPTTPAGASFDIYATTDTPEIECLKGRKWWCFLLSSIFTFLAGLLVVLLWRAFAFICCRKEPELSPNDPKQKEQKANRQGKQEFEGTFMTEAKDWAGELISGQTTTGRILVRTYKMLSWLRCGHIETMSWCFFISRRWSSFSFSASRRSSSTLSTQQTNTSRCAQILAIT